MAARTVLSLHRVWPRQGQARLLKDLVRYRRQQRRQARAAPAAVGPACLTCMLPGAWHVTCGCLAGYVVQATAAPDPVAAAAPQAPVEAVP